VKTLGIIGGLGPMATVYFMELIIKMTDVKTDQEHMRIYLQSLPDTPDRTAYICGETDENPLPFFVKAGTSLSEQGADFIAIPCVTAQYFYKELSDNLDVPVIHLIEGLIKEIKANSIKKVGILATDGTIRSKLLQNQLIDNGIDVIIPGQEDQASIMDIIYNQIKAGKPVNLSQFFEVVQRLKKQGAEKLILGCTELSLIKRDFKIDSDCIDVLDVLAKNTVLYSGAPLKKEYQELL